MVRRVTRNRRRPEASCQTIVVQGSDDDEGGGDDDVSHSDWSRRTERRSGSGSSPTTGGGRGRGGGLFGRASMVSTGAVTGSLDLSLRSLAYEEDDELGEGGGDDDDVSFAARSVQSSGSSQLWDRLESNRMRMEATENKWLRQDARRKLRVRQCARATTSLLALAALCLLAAYFFVGKDLEAVLQGDLFRSLVGQEKEDRDYWRYRSLGNDDIQARAAGEEQRAPSPEAGGGVPVPWPPVEGRQDKELRIQARERPRVMTEREERLAARALRLEARERRERERAARPPPRGVGGEEAVPPTPDRLHRP